MHVNQKVSSFHIQNSYTAHAMPYLTKKIELCILKWVPIQLQVNQFIYLTRIMYTVVSQLILLHYIMHLFFFPATMHINSITCWEMFSAYVYNRVSCMQCTLKCILNIGTITLKTPPFKEHYLKRIL